MKTKVILLVVSLVCLPALSGYAQSSLCPSGSRKLVCELPISPVDYSVAGAEAEKQAASKLNPINASFATQLTQLPIPSAAVGVVNLRDKGSESIGTPYDNLGPILTDRPDTVGKHYLFGGFSYQHFNFNKVDGVGLGSVPVGYTFLPTPTVQGDQQTIYGGFNTNISFKLDQYVALLTFGVSRSTDVTLILPFNSVTLNVVASNFQAYIYDPVLNQYSNESYPPGTKNKIPGSASGIGDVSLGVKQMIHGIEGEHTAVSVGAQIRFPSGDKLNYLGSGAWGVNVYGLVSYRWKVTPHLKLAYQWNGVSDLINPTDTAGGSQKLPGGLQYDLGADYRIRHSLTAAVDILGSQFVNTPSLTLHPSLTLTPTPPSPLPATLATVSAVNNTYTTANLSTGLKFSKAGFLLYGNVLIPLNNEGLRSDPVPLFGASYHLHLGKK